MCGIAGVFSINPFIRPSLDRIKMMTDVIAHRGPDGEGIWTNNRGGVVLGHRRLSIIDLSAEASQPMHSFDQRYTIIFNGEIYNYKELRDELKSEGAEFKTNSDTEVLLKLFAKVGKDCLPKLDGMFAFCIWDEEEQKMFCARDRFGEKPFFYYFKNGLFVFASEIKAVLTYLDIVDFNYDYLQQYLNGGFQFSDLQTVFNDIQALASASSMLINSDGIEIEKYWEIDLSKKLKLENDEDYFSKFQKLFLESIEFRLRSDVPVGSSLSGGLDSSTVVGTLTGLEKKEMHTFSARFKSEKDEGKWIAEVTSKSKMVNHEVWPDEDGFIEHLEEMTWHHEFPLASSSVYAQWCVMALPCNWGVKVLLDGQGADEYLCGYDELKYFAIWDLYHNGDFASFIHEKKLFDKNYGNHGRLGMSFLVDPFLSWFGFKRKVYRNGYTLKEQLKFYTSHKLGELLRIADRNSMAFGLEVRLPFLSHKLVEFVFSIPDHLIYREGKTKFILREAMKSFLPKAIYNRTDKIGFAPPQHAWMESDVFKKKYSESLEILSSSSLTPGPDQFKNLATSTLLKVFLK
jgi:asparagine synthase (glutamine-hydrolysing)